MKYFIAFSVCFFICIEAFTQKDTSVQIIKEFAKSREFRKIYRTGIKKSKIGSKEVLSIDSIIAEYAFNFDSAFLKEYEIEQCLNNLSNQKKCRKFCKAYIKLGNFVKKDTNYISVHFDIAHRLFMDFKKLSKENQKKKVIAILERMKHIHDDLASVLDALKLSESPDPVLLQNIYLHTMKFGGKAKKLQNPKYPESIRLYLALPYYFLQ